MFKISMHASGNMPLCLVEVELIINGLMDSGCVVEELAVLLMNKSLWLIGFRNKLSQLLRTKVMTGFKPPPNDQLTSHLFIIIIYFFLDLISQELNHFLMFF